MPDKPILKVCTWCKRGLFPNGTYHICGPSDWWDFQRYYRKHYTIMKETCPHCRKKLDAAHQDWLSRLDEKYGG